MITLDNSSNNNTMIEAMEKLLCQCGIEFDRDGNWIRFVLLRFLNNTVSFWNIWKCFSHIVNIAVKTGLKYLTKPPKIDAEVDPDDIMESFLTTLLHPMMLIIRKHFKVTLSQLFTNWLMPSEPQDSIVKTSTRLLMNWTQILLPIGPTLSQQRNLMS